MFNLFLFFFIMHALPEKCAEGKRKIKRGFNNLKLIKTLTRVCRYVTYTLAFLHFFDMSSKNH